MSGRRPWHGAQAHVRVTLIMAEAFISAAPPGPFPLAHGAEMARTAADALHFYRRSASDAGLPSPVVNLVGELEAALPALGIAVILESRAVRLDGQGEDPLHRLIEPRGLVLPDG